MTEDCGILNLATCIPEKLYDFVMNVLNSPIQPLLNLIKSLLTEPVQLNNFLPLWAIIIYVLSLFYGIILLYSGFNFMVSGYDAEKRSKAKEWFRNTLIMIVLVQASYFIYVSVVDIGSLLTAGVINLVDPQFFLLSADNIVNLGLQFFFVLMYVLVLLITTVILTFRYIILAVGVVLAPIGIFLYFIPPLSSYGKLVLNFLGICIFISFFDSLIFLVCAELLSVELFQNFKILLMIASFSIANIMMFYFMFFSIVKSAILTGGKVASVAKYFS